MESQHGELTIFMRGQSFRLVLHSCGDTFYMRANGIMVLPQQPLSEKEAREWYHGVLKLYLPLAQAIDGL